MTPEQYERVRQIFLAVRNLPDSHREAYVNKSCQGDPALRAEVESFLAAQADAQGFIDTPALGTSFGLGRQATLDAIDQVPERIGHYRVLEVIARGGMGVVYLAERDDTGQRVALKVMRPDVVNPEIVRRFEHEGSILALLKHHGMAQIYEVGSFDAGQGIQPFFAMEYVRGVPLLEYATYEQLSINERLALMIKICAAVQYSHHKGVIHRDLKPSNILVDQSGQPKLVDFGIARITDSDIRATQAETEAGQVLGTLPYMSPEQCDPDPHALDTRSDVYSLGVVCYELLTGSLPYEVGDSILQAVRAITNTAPTAMHSYNAFINEDLHRIVTRALAKDKDERIQSAGEFGEELGRFLRGEPLQTVPVERPPSRMRAVLRRLRVAAAIVLAAGLVALGALAGRLLGPAAPPVAAPTGPVGDGATTAALATSYEALVQDLVREVAAADDPIAAAPLLGSLDDLSRSLRGATPAPAVEAALRQTLARCYLALDRPAAAREQLERSYELYRDLHGPDDVRTQEVRAELDHLLARPRPPEPDRADSSRD